LTAAHRRVAFAQGALADLDAIAHWTRERFGPKQAERYDSAIEAAIIRLSEVRPGRALRPRPDLGEGIHAYALRNVSPRARHVFYFRVEADSVLILRVLNNAMEPVAHLEEDLP
jgi:plasmid stabilization system protein ParE